MGFLNVFVTKSVGNRFHELSLGRNDRLGLGTSKIEFLAKNTKKNQGKSMIFLVFPVWGPALESYESERAVVCAYVPAANARM